MPMFMRENVVLRKKFIAVRVYTKINSSKMFMLFVIGHQVFLLSPRAAVAKFHTM